MYDRTTLIDAAVAAGIENPNQLAIRLGVGRMTAHRLWNGTAAPTATVAATVRAELGVDVADLLVPAEGVPAADGAA